MHCASSNLNVVGLLQHAALLHPKMRELQNQILKIEALQLFLKFYFNFQVASKSARVSSCRSTWCSIQHTSASRSSPALARIDSSYEIRSTPSPAKRSARSRASSPTRFIPPRRPFSQYSP